MPEQILSLPIEKKIGQLFFIGIPGAEFDEAARDLVTEIAPGGVCLFARNIREAAATRKLLDGIIKACEIVPFLSLDQEGGLVDRLRRVVEPMPSVDSLKSGAEVEKLAEITAEILLILGFNMNFAPVVDISDESRQRFVNGLNSRTYGKSKETSLEFGKIYLEKLQEKGITGCLKHFPGLGASEIDSHENLPFVNLPQEDLEENDLFPFREIFKTGNARAVMLAHAAFPNSDLQETNHSGKMLPSSLSFNFTTELLRNKMLFGGISITDDLEMGAILNNFDIGEACRTAICAGADMLAICNKPETIREGFASVSEAVKRGEISESRIDESLRRIAEVKNLLNFPLAFDENRLRELSVEIVKLKTGA